MTFLDFVEKYLSDYPKLPESKERPNGVGPVWHAIHVKGNPTPKGRKWLKKVNQYQQREEEREKWFDDRQQELVSLIETAEDENLINEALCSAGFGTFGRTSSLKAAAIRNPIISEDVEEQLHIAKNCPNIEVIRPLAEHANSESVLRAILEHWKGLGWRPEVQNHMLALEERKLKARIADRVGVKS